MVTVSVKYLSLWRVWTVSWVSNLNQPINRKQKRQAKKGKNRKKKEKKKTPKPVLNISFLLAFFIYFFFRFLDFPFSGWGWGRGGTVARAGKGGLGGEALILEDSKILAIFISIRLWGPFTKQIRLRTNLRVLSGFRLWFNHTLTYIGPVLVLGQALA